MMQAVMMVWVLAATMGQGPVVAADAAELWGRVVTVVSAITLNDHENGEVLGTLGDQMARVERGEALPQGVRLHVTLAAGGADRLRRSECTREGGAVALPGHGVPFVCGDAGRVRVHVADDRVHARIEVALP